MRVSPVVSNSTPNFLDVLARRPWTDRAACKDLDDQLDPMFPELPVDPSRMKLGSGTLLLPLLICERCPVRHECLSESLEPVWFTRREKTEERGEVISQSGTGMRLMTTPAVSDGEGFVCDPAAAGVFYATDAVLQVFEENAGSSNSSTVRYESHGVFIVQRVTAFALLTAAS